MKNKTGVLIVNLGTPDSPAVKDVRRYLREFLFDGRVIDIPALQRWMLVNLIIAPFRAPKSAKVYQKVWTQNGSPLKYYGEQNQKVLQAKLGDNFEVKLAMRYQNPSLKKELAIFKKQGMTKIIVVPMFPQYASATTGSVMELVMAEIATWQIIPEIKLINAFYDNPKYIQGFVDNAKKIMKGQNFEHYLFSYHGLPERQIHKGDYHQKICKLGSCCDSIVADNQFCYRAQCFATTRLLVDALGLAPGTYSTCFQSRLGKTPWIQPYSDDTIVDLAKKGVKSVLAFSPAFVADCLETTIEVGEEYKELFLEHGGKQWELVESLNDNEIWTDLLAELVLENQ